MAFGHGDLREEFKDKHGNVGFLTAQAVSNVHKTARAERGELFAKEIAADDNQSSENTVNGYAAVQPNQEKKRELTRAQKQRLEQLFLSQLQALQNEIAALDEQIANLEKNIEETKDVLNAFENGEMDFAEMMQQDATKRAITEWEARTGKKFDPSSPDAETALIIILQEQAEIDKATMEAAKKRKSEIEQQIEGFEGRLAAGESFATVLPDVEEAVNPAYASGAIAGYVTKHDEIRETARTSQTDHRFNGLTDVEDTTTNSSFMGMLESDGSFAAVDSPTNAFRNAASEKQVEQEHPSNTYPSVSNEKIIIPSSGIG